MSDAPRVSRSLAIFDLDHGILKASPAAMLGPQYATAERISRLAGPLLGPALFRVLTPNGGTSEDIRDAGRTAAATIELAPHAAKLLEQHRDERRRLIGTTHAPVVCGL